MLIEPYNDLSVNLSNVSILEIYQDKTGKLGEKLFNVRFNGRASHGHVEKPMVDFYEKKIEEFNASGRGAFFWLFPNICINADKVTSVARFGSALWVSYGNGVVWNSHDHLCDWKHDGTPPEELAKKIHADFISFARKREETLAARFAAVTDVSSKKKAEPAVPAKSPEPPPAAPPAVYTESKGLPKIRNF